MTNSPEITTATSNEHLKGVSRLQLENLKHVLMDSELREEGFVTMQYDMALLHKMQDFEPQIIVVVDDQVVGYALVTVCQLKNQITLLTPLFDLIEGLVYKGRKLSESRYYVMGQVCIAKPYRGKGVFKRLFEKHKEVFSTRYDYCITEVSKSNPRSLRAHEKVGFKIIHTYSDHLDDWLVVLLEL